MSYSDYKDYIESKYPELSSGDITFLFKSCETVYLNCTAPFNKSKTFDDTDERAINWVTRAVISILDMGAVDVKSYSENGISLSINTTLMSELVTEVGSIETMVEDVVEEVTDEQI